MLERQSDGTEGQKMERSEDGRWKLDKQMPEWMEPNGSDTTKVSGYTKLSWLQVESRKSDDGAMLKQSTLIIN
jgi:hypothetical protein